MKHLKRWLLLLVAAAATFPVVAQSEFGVYYDCRFAAHQKEGMERGSIVWFGDSITEQAWWEILTQERPLANRGIGGDNTRGMYERLDEILSFAPRKIFFMGGVNDLSGNKPVEEIVENVRKMLELVKAQAPQCEFYLQSVITPNNEVLAYSYIKNKQEQVRELNRRYKALCDEGLAIWVDVASLLENEQGEVREELTKDGVHLHPQAYRIWIDHLKKMKYLRK